MYYLAKFVRSVLLRLPLWMILIFGKTIGLFMYLSVKKRRVAFKNVKSAFPAKSRKEILSILRRSFSGFGLAILEGLIYPRIHKNIEVRGDENIGLKGGIFVGIHSGNWEVAISVFAHRHKLAVFVQEQKHKTLDKFLNEMRQEGKIKICFSLKALIKCIKENYFIGVVIDHGAGDDAVIVDFFSHQVPTPKGAIYLAKKFNKKLYPTFCHRKGNFSHLLEIGKPIDPRGKDDKDVLRSLNEIYENYITKNPWEYFWYYKRFKRKINRDVLILSDCRTGHLKQSRALLALLSERGYVIKSEMIEMRYKSKLMRIVANIFAFFAGHNCLWCGRVLPFLIDNNTWERLDKIYADIVISTGSYVAPVNKLFSSYLGAKSAIILRSNIPLGRFDLAIVPEHDRIQTDKAIIIKGALFDSSSLDERRKKCKDFFNLSSKNKISLFIGGPLTDKHEFMHNLKLFIPKLKEFVAQNDQGLLVSTSRRTPPEAESYLESELRDFKNIEALVVANKRNYDFVFEGFCVLADIIFVSNESISMVSEVVSMQKPCVCVSLEIEDDKRKVFLESIASEVEFFNPPYKGIESIKPKASSIFTKNKKSVKEAIGKLL